MKYVGQIYSDAEIKLIKEIFDMYMKQIYDEDLKDLINQCKEMFLNNQKLMKENERLNNIINELEHHLYQEWLEWKDSDCESIYSRAGEDKAIYDYLQELKGNESN